MSWQKGLLNTSLRWMEKPHLARVQSPVFLRRSADAKAAFWFHPPRGTRYSVKTIPTAAGDLPITQAVPPHAKAGRVLLYAHGGGYVFGSARTHRALVAQICARIGAVGMLPDYRRAPEHIFPAAFDDLRAAYDHLLASGIKPENLLLAGDSAGGGLALGLLGDLLKRNHSLPAGVLALSPLTDMTFSGDSFIRNRHREALLPAHRAREAAEMYLQGHDPTDPRVSPLLADFRGAPPVYLAAGTTEILRDDSLRMAETLRAQGVRVEMELQEDLPHVWPLFHGLLPEARQTLDRIAGWVKPLWTSAGGS